MTGTNVPEAKVPVEEQYENPAKVKIGGVMSVNTIDYSNLIFVVKELWQWNREINGNKRTITDYKLLARPHDGEDLEVIVRIIPRENPDAKYTHDFAVLTKFFECGWDDEGERDGVLEALADPEGKLVWHKGEEDEQTFFLMNKTLGLDVNVIADLNGNGEIEEDEVRDEKYDLYVYARDTLDEAKQPMTEFFFVQHDLTARDFAMWKGEVVDPSRIKA